MIWMKPNLKGKRLGVIVIVVFAALVPSVIFLVDWFDKNVVNPRIWESMSCDEMKEFAMKFEDEKLTPFQRAKFHEDLSLCMR